MTKIWAVALNTIKQALRMKIAIIFIILLAVLLPTMALTTTGDNTLKGRLQTFVSYGLSLTSFLLCLLTVIVAAFTLASDLKNRQIYTVITKPLRRSQYILGKLLGVLLLSGALLLLFSAIIYAIVVYTPVYLNSTPSEIAQAKNEFYTARKAVAPPQPDVSKEVVSTLKKLVASGNIQDMYEGMPAAQIDALREVFAKGDIDSERIYRTMADTEIVGNLTNVLRLSKRTADLGKELIWEFHNVKPTDPNGSVFVRFKFEGPGIHPDAQIYSQWLVGDYRGYLQGTTPMYPIRRTDPVKTLREMQIPAEAVADDGYLAVAFFNDPANGTPVTFPTEDGIEVLYKAGTFTANFVRAVLIIACRQVFLACLGIFAATFLSFPVAMLLCMVIFFSATVSGFIIDAFHYISSKDVFTVYFYTIRLLISLLPQFDKFGFVNNLISAELLDSSVLGRVLVYIVCIKSMLLLFVALLVFRFRELARIII